MARPSASPASHSRSVATLRCAALRCCALLRSASDGSGTSCNSAQRCGAGVRHCNGSRGIASSDAVQPQRMPTGSMLHLALYKYLLHGLPTLQSPAKAQVPERARAVARAVCGARSDDDEARAAAQRRRPLDQPRCGSVEGRASAPAGLSTAQYSVG